MLTVTLDEARERLTELVEAAARGEIVTITHGGTPVAKLGPAFDRQAMEEAFVDMDRIRARTQPLRPGELRDMLEEGRSP